MDSGSERMTYASEGFSGVLRTGPASPPLPRKLIIFAALHQPGITYIETEYG
jgi:hypothetical protein